MTVANFNLVTSTTNWLNSDGLLVKFGTTEGQIAPGGDYEDTVKGLSVIEFRLNAKTDIPISTGSNVPTILGTGGIPAELPKGAIIDHVDIFVETAGTGSSAVFNLGLANSFDFSVLDYQALITAETQSNLGTIGTRKTYDVATATFAGSKLGIVASSTHPTILTACSDGTHAWTAGKFVVTVFYYQPDTATGGQ